MRMAHSLSMLKVVQAIWVCTEYKYDFRCEPQLLKWCFGTWLMDVRDLFEAC